jgi:hypothetical protein
MLRRSELMTLCHFCSYVNHRLVKIRGLRWETGAVLPERIRHDTLSARENDFFGDYSGILTEYCENVSLDLTSDLEVTEDCHPHITDNVYPLSPLLEWKVCLIYNIVLSHWTPQPPKELFIQVRVLEPCGEIMTDSGPVTLDERGSSHYLRRLVITNVEIIIFVPPSWLVMFYLAHIPGRMSSISFVRVTSNTSWTMKCRYHKSYRKLQNTLIQFRILHFGVPIYKQLSLNNITNITKCLMKTISLVAKLVEIWCSVLQPKVTTILICSHDLVYCSGHL